MSRWISDNRGVLDAGDVGGDIQAGPAWERRFVWSDDAGNPQPFPYNVGIGNEQIEVPAYALINDHYYAVLFNPHAEPDDEDANIYDVQNQVEYMIVTNLDDPGGTELWSDYEYDVNEIGFDSDTRADVVAKSYAENLRACDYTWDPERNSP